MKVPPFLDLDNGLGNTIGLMHSWDENNHNYYNGDSSVVPSTHCGPCIILIT